jgi:hypothetical protein
MISATSPLTSQRWLVPNDVPLVRAVATRFIVERLSIVEGVVLAAMEYIPNSLPHLTVTHAVRLSRWSFTLWIPPLWGGGCATERTQSDRFSALANLAMVSQRPVVLRPYQRELQAWNHYL